MWWCRALSGNNLCFVHRPAQLYMPHSNVPVLQKRCEPVWRGAHNYYRLANESTLHKNRCITWVFHKCSKACRYNRVKIWKLNVALCFSVLFFCLIGGGYSTEHSLVTQKHIHCALKKAFLLTSRTLHEDNSTWSKYEKILKWGKTKVICWSYPGTPPASMWLARVTSCDQTSYCHFWRPITPQRTFPECTPTRMLMSTPVASLTFLK